MCTLARGRSCGGYFDVPCLSRNIIILSRNIIGNIITLVSFFLVEENACRLLHEDIFMLDMFYLALFLS